MSGTSTPSLDAKEAFVSIVQEPTQKINGSSGVLAAGGSVELYAPIPEYEGRHRYDPTAEWTEKEEKVLVRRVVPLHLVISIHLSDDNIAGLQNLFLGLPDVFCPSAGSWQYLTSTI
jgi:hypothetical protein